ncbi:MAG: AAA family ATPase, partial [Patescibacteria group bacterium]
SDDKKYLLIHKKDSGNFGGTIEVQTVLELGEEDNKVINDKLTESKLLAENPIKNIKITKKVSFVDNKFTKEKSATIWQFEPELNVKTKRAQTYSRLYATNNELWNQIVSDLQKNLPKILYFSNFLFDFPEKIYLEDVVNMPVSEKEKEQQGQYRQIIDDILRSQNNRYSLKDFLSKIKDSSNSSSQSAAETQKQDIANILNQKILARWEEIFPGGPKKTISVKTDTDLNNYFIKIEMLEGGQPFSINERSLGFRWFFAFILFTEFRKKRDGESGEYLFLFDEPASNMHEGSQKRLLKLFEELSDGAKIIYSTHSPYLLDDKNILNTFVVKDDGRKSDVEFNFRQDIKATLYKQFISNNEINDDNVMHFKPILDVLEYREHPFIPTGKIVFLEGKSDYYAFKLIKEKFFDDQYDFTFYPGTSVDKYENQFREYLANNRKFIAIFDDDSAGKCAKIRYLEKVSQELEKNIFTLKDVKESFGNFQTERLFHTEAERLRIQKLSSPDIVKYKKDPFNMAIQELYLKNRDFVLLDTTKENFEKVFNFIKKKFDALEN